MNLDHEYTLNPDGSGKVVLHWEGPEGVDSGEFVRSEIGEARGVDAWSGVSCTSDGGHMQFDATAYFPSLEGLRLHCQGFHFNLLDFAAGTDGKGNFVLRGKATRTEGSPGSPDLEGEELRARIAEEREKIAPARAFLAEMFGSLVCCSTIHLPGRIARNANSKKIGDRSLRQVFSGQAFLDVIDRILTDDDLAAQVVRSGTEGPEALQQFLEDVGPVEAETEGELTPAFDYASEVAAAKEAFEEMRKEMHVPDAPREAPPLENARVVALKLVLESDSDRDFSPGMQNHTGASLTIAGDLPGPALSLKEALLQSATTDSGAELAPESEWSRTAHFPKLTSDHRTAYFEFDLGLPPPEAAGWKEIRGVVRTVAAEGEEEVDLGFPALEPGAEGDRAAAVLLRAEDEGEGRFTLEVKLGVARSTVLSMSLALPDGTAVPLRESGYSASGNECELTYVGEGAFDRAARLVARMATGLQEYVVPFLVENVDLLGRPR